jgi:hypothetical protein
MAFTLASLHGLAVSRPWLSDHGVLYLELGRLKKARLSVPRSNGTRDIIKGDVTLFAGYMWRLDGPQSIHGSNQSSPSQRERLIGKMAGREIVLVRTTASVPELEVVLSNGLTLRTFSVDAGQPHWTISWNHVPRVDLTVKRGRICTNRRAA